MATDKITFYKFLENNTIEIPRIQRDYVQGRAITVEQKEKRNDFANNLIDALEKGGHPCVLDFIYGFTTGEGKTSTFIPLDGQQRLTSLYLLHWYLLHLISKKQPTDETSVYDADGEKMQRLNGSFKYNNRISSTEFCQRLTSKDRFIKIDDEIGIRKEITQQPWFDEEWIFDPTIGTMLDMLQVYESILREKEYNCLTEMAENLFVNKCIYFDKLSLEDLHQGESLYVKMNARGKKLTRFENWKAKFTKMLEDVHNDEEFECGDGQRCNSKKYKDYFCYSIEHDWNDLFWHYVTKDIQWDNISDVMNNAYPTVDKAFSNFLRFVHQILYFYDKNDEKAKIGDFQWTFAQNEETYGKKKNLERLFQYLDFLAYIENNYEKDKEKKGLDAFFGDIFYIKDKNVYEWKDHRVRIYADNVNLFEKAINNLDDSSKFNLSEMYLLWAILSYCAQKYCENRQGGFKVDDDLRYYVRSCRNNIDAADQFLTATVSLTSRLRVIDAHSIITKFPGSTTTCKKYNNDELQKLYEWLDDFDYLYEGNGNSNHAYLPILEKINKGETDITVQQVQNFAKGFEKSSTLDRIKLLIGAGYKGKTEIGATGENRERYFFGQENRWSVLFVEDAEKLSPILEQLISDYKNNVETLINEYTEKASKNTFAYYMLTYEYALWGQNDCNAIYDKRNGYAFFAVSGELDDMDIISLRSISSQPLSAYHIDPLVCAVVNNCIDTCQNLLNHISMCGRFGTKHGIAIMNSEQDDCDFEMVSNKDGWTIRTDKNDILQKITKNNNIAYENNIFELCENDTKETDKVKIGTAILKAIININNW